MSNEGPGYPQDRPAQPWPPAGPQFEQQPPTPGAPGYGPQYPQQAYGQPQYQPAYQPDQVRFQPGGPVVEHPQATLAFVLGLLSVLGLTILGPFGWYYGNKVVAEIDRDSRVFQNRGIAMAGKVLGIIGTVFLAFTVLAVIGLIVFAMAAGRR